MSFAVMVVGAAVVTISGTIVPALVGTMILGTGMGVANAAIFELVPKYVPDAVGGASGWNGGIGGAGTLIVLPFLGVFVDVFGEVGYAWGFSIFVALSAICTAIVFALKYIGPDADVDPDETVAH